MNTEHCTGPAMRSELSRRGYAPNEAFVFLPLLPENRGGELTTFSIFVALSLIAAVAVVVANGSASLSNQGRTISENDWSVITSYSLDWGP